MSEFLEIYDPYGDFNKESFFVKSFDCIPSHIRIEFPFKSSKETICSVLDMLGLDTLEAEIITKGWQISTNINTVEGEDYPNSYFFKSKTKPLCFTVQSFNEELSLEYIYHHADEALEKWILESVSKIRNTFGKKKSPTFKVLSRNANGFSTEEININEMNIDVEKYYNDDFLPIHQTIAKSVESHETSGLILLHGSPGTGKTSYIKNLLSQHNEQSFIFIPNDFVNELLQPNFISFLVNHRNSVLVVEDAEKVITSRDHNENSVVSTILQLTDGLFSDYLNIKIICTFNTDIDRVDKALLRKGRMIAFYKFEALTIQKTNQLLVELGEEARNEEMSVAEIFNIAQQGFEEKAKNSIGFGKV